MSVRVGFIGDPLKLIKFDGEHTFESADGWQVGGSGDLMLTSTGRGFMSLAPGTWRFAEMGRVETAKQSRIVQ